MRNKLEAVGVDITKTTRALAIAGCMVLVALLARYNGADKNVPRQPQPTMPGEALPTTIPEANTTTSSSSTTVPESLGSRVLLATGLHIDNLGMRFKHGRAAGIDCHSQEPDAVRSNSIKLPRDLGQAANSYNPRVNELSRIVFLGQQIRPPDSEYTYLGEGLALALNGGYSILDFKVEKAFGGLGANTIGRVVGEVTTGDLQRGVTYRNETMTFTAQFDPTSSQLDATIKCN